MNIRRVRRDPEEMIKILYQELQESSFTVAISGAGISIAAGGVTYAGMGSKGGLSMRSNDPQKMYEGFYKVFMQPAFEHGPTVAHKALAKLEEMGQIGGVITTNVDCMHTMAGSKNVAEIQGSFQVNVCTGCGQITHGYEIWNHGEMPMCPHCGKMLLPYNMYSHAGLLEEEVKKAQDYMRQADLILVIGATGCYAQTYWGYQKRDTKLIQINPGRTQFDAMTDVNIREGSDEAFQALMKLEGEAI